VEKVTKPFLSHKQQVDTNAWNG